MSQQNLRRIEVSPGVHLNFVENDRYKTNFITFDFLTPLNRVTASYNTVLSRVLTRGCERYPSQLMLNRALDELYDASLSSDSVKVGEWHTLSVSLSLLDNAFTFDGQDLSSEGLSLLEQVIFHPLLPSGAFCEEYVKGEKKQALLEIASLVNNKARYAKGRMIEHMCKLEPYSTCAIGNRSEIGKITAESLAAYYKKLLKTAQIEIFFVGRFDQEKVREQIGAMLCGPERAFEPLPALSIRTKARTVKEITETMDITQANLVMGFRTACTIYDPSWRAMSLYNAVLGGSLTSKLFCVLREKMSLCYSISSTPDALKGIMSVYAGIAPENREVAIREALNQMEEIRKGNITPEELENARGALIHSLRGLQDNPAVLADWYLPRILTGNFQTPDEIIAELKGLTAEDVVKVSESITLDTVYTLTGKEAK
ncbi:MAG: insulinase family protein [Ruminococcaceae bacterium]|nr:insulinase family protein [Oscillospiraceae bacterium]